MRALRFSIPPPPPQRRISLWVKLPYTAWVLVLLPLWIAQDGWRELLWMSDVALCGLCIALWWESALLAGMMTLATLVFELCWAGAYVHGLATGAPIDSIAYMFDQREPLHTRTLSLFHLFLPVVELWAVQRLGYDRRALMARTLLLWLLLPASYWASDAETNVNFVYGLGSPPLLPLAPLPWTLTMMAAIALLVYVPLHLALSRWAR